MDEDCRTKTTNPLCCWECLPPLLEALDTPNVESVRFLSMAAQTVVRYDVSWCPPIPVSNLELIISLALSVPLRLR
jgi:hypothetical protein